MELMRLRPFGQRKKTYFYGVAAFVLVAHVVVGAILHVMPPEFDEPGHVMSVEVQVIDHLLPDEVIETNAVKMIEEVPLEEEEPPVFTPVWDGGAIAPEPEPLGPTETVLPDLVVEEPVVVPELEPNDAEAPVKDNPPPAKPESKPPTRKDTPPKSTSKSPPVKKSSTPKPVSKPPVKPEPEPAPPAPEPEIEPPLRAIPVPSSTARKGLLDRVRSRASAPSTSSSDPYVPPTWEQRPPPFYPYEQRKRGIEGTAHVRVTINSSGQITSARLVKSSGNAQLDEAALLSVRKGTMNPARRGGRAVSSEMIVPFEFYE
jgi:protein TonB